MRNLIFMFFSGLKAQQKNVNVQKQKKKKRKFLWENFNILFKYFNKQNNFKNMRHYNRYNHFKVLFSLNKILICLYDVISDASF